MKEIDHTRPKTIKEKINSMFCVKLPLYKTWWIYPVVLILLSFFVFAIPMLINKLYIIDDGYITLWGASEVLAFYAVVLSGIISIATVVVTVYCSKKGTDRQIRFYMSQTKTPFFTIQTVTQNGSIKHFYRDDRRRWIKEFDISKPGALSESGSIEITVKNIGDGIALKPSYKIDMMASTIVPDSIIENGKYMALSFDLLRNLNEKYVQYYFVEGFEKLYEGTTVCFTRIHLEYQNILGVDLRQEILVEIEFNFQRKQIVLKVNDLSPQRVMI